MSTDFSLSPEELAFFRENGFTRPFRVYEVDEALKLGKTIARRGGQRISSIYGEECFANYDRHLDIEELAAHICRPEIVQRVQSILGSDVLCWRSEFFTKYPGDPGTEWHQVEVYQYSTGLSQLTPTVPGTDPFQVTCWTAFTPATLANGCMRLLPGSHKKWYFDESKHVERPGLFDAREMAKKSGFWGYDYEDFKIDPSWDPDLQPSQAMEMTPGEAFIFTAKCVHGSYGNTTKDQVRFSFGARYVSTQVKLYKNMTEFTEHGSYFNLKDYGAVLVGGEDRFNHNPIRTTTTRNVPFAPPQPAR